MFNVKSMDEVFQILKDNFSGISSENETVGILECVNRITSFDIASPEDIPGFNRSSVDGYAVISSDTFGAGDSIPAQLELAGEVKMGIKPPFVLKNGQTAYVPTGGELPDNADAMVMVEYTEDFNDGYVYINKPVAPGSNVVFKGDDMKAESTVIKAHRRLRPQDAGAFAAIGASRVNVKRKIKVGIISTGDEVVKIDSKTTGSQVRDINTYSLCAGILEYGAEPRIYGIVGDEYEKIKELTGKAVDKCDVVLISGGSSVGSRDQTRKVISSFGAPGVLVHGIAVKPGKPTIIGKVKGKAIFGLPGHPVSAYIVYKIFVCYLLDVINRLADEPAKTVRAVAAGSYPSNNGRDEFVPVILKSADKSPSAFPLFGKSGLITLLAQADGYIHIKRSSEGLCAGEEVEVFPF